MNSFAETRATLFNADPETTHSDPMEASSKTKSNWSLKKSMKNAAAGLASWTKQPPKPSSNDSQTTVIPNTSATPPSTRSSFLNKWLGKKEEQPSIPVAAEKTVKKKDSASTKKTKIFSKNSKSQDVERNDRHSCVMNILKGKKQLPEAFTSKYSVGYVLGDGAFGFVMTGTARETGEEVAVKFIIKDKVPKDLWVRDAKLGVVPREIEILSSLNCPYIIKYFDHYVDEDYVILVTEFHGTEWSPSNPQLNPKQNPGLRSAPVNRSNVDNSESSPLFRLTKEQEMELASRRKTSVDLFECIDAHVKFSMYHAQRIFRQIVEAVYYLNNKKIVHRDLKDENIVIDKHYNIRLIDFGSASFIPKDRESYFTKFNGTAHFASPEIASGRPYRGPEADIWALGVLLFTIIFGENPFANRAEILRGEYKFPHPIEPTLADLIDRMLTYDERKRATIEQVMAHDWLRVNYKSSTDTLHEDY